MTAAPRWLVLSLLFAAATSVLRDHDGPSDAADPQVLTDNLDPDLVDGVQPLKSDKDLTEAKYMKVEFDEEDFSEIYAANESSDDPLAAISSASKQSFLRIHRPLVNYTKFVGENIRMKCEVEGFPMPRFRWFKNEAPVREEKSKLIIRRFRSGGDKYVSRLRISNLEIMDTGYYRCQASTDGLQVKTTAILQVKLGKGELPGTIPSYAPVFPNFPDVDGGGPTGDMTGLTGECQVYRGNSVCSNYVGNSSVFIRPPNTIDDLDRRTMATFSVLSSNKEITKTCEKFAIKVMCYHTFPLCSSASDKDPRTLCRDECNVLENEICVKEYALARANDLIGRNNIIPDCQELPTYGDDGAQTCIRIGISTPPEKAEVPVSVSNECYFKKGEDYRGTVSHTASGKQCLAWSSKILDKLDKYPELKGHNHCRNPGGHKKKPWCYTNDALAPLELCDISKCDKECFTNRGEDYQGQVSRTVSGKECLAWSTKILDQLSTYPELKDHNYCRNPGGQEERPWCYTRDELMPVEMCEINECVPVSVSSECYTKKGEDYLGTVSRTASGKHCLAWSSKILGKLDKYPELKDHNHCRNPGGHEEKPWCYTGDELKPVELCDISKCEEECFIDRGVDYKGQVSRTVSGKECLAWSTKILDQLDKYPELKDHNYCRNPGGQEDQPWCYTGDELKPVEICDVSECGSVTWMYIVIPAVCILVFGILLCAICCIRRRSRTRSQPPPKSVTDLPTLPQSFNSHKFMGHDVEMNSIWQKSIGPIRVREVPPSTVTYFEELGEGTFGNVYRGEVSALNMDRTVTSVVIKTLKTGASTTMFQNFRQEVEVMTDLKHPNIVCLLAVCIYDQPFCMLFECPMGGNLHEYLMKSSRSASASSDKSRSYCSLDVGEFLCISTQVASGMEYLSSQHYVHRDLAARNCLIGENLNVKISNFGLARDTYACDYYHSPVNGLLPIRWMPAEAILYGRFSTESDVWSFGIFLWEILSHGRQPYYGYSNQEVIDMISSRQVLPCPEDSSTQVYGLMLECWSDVAAKRPTFQELHLRLHSWQVLHNMGNLNSSQFFRPHSDSQYSSTGPSNRTGSTHVSSVAAPSSGKSQYDGGSTHSAISSQPVTVIGMDRSRPPQQASSVRSDSPSHSSTAGLYPSSMQSSSILEPRISDI